MIIFPTEQPKQRSKNDTASAVDKKKGVEIMSEQDGSPKWQKHDSGKTRSAELENEITVLSTGHEVQAAAHSSDAKGGAMKLVEGSEEKGKTGVAATYVII